MFYSFHLLNQCFQLGELSYLSQNLFTSAAVICEDDEGFVTQFKNPTKRLVKLPYSFHRARHKIAVLFQWVAIQQALDPSF